MIAWNSSARSIWPASSRTMGPLSVATAALSLAYYSPLTRSTRAAGYPLQILHLERTWNFEVRSFPGILNFFASRGNVICAAKWAPEELCPQNGQTAFSVNHVAKQAWNWDECTPVTSNKKFKIGILFFSRIWLSETNNERIISNVGVEYCIISRQGW